VADEGGTNMVFSLSLDAPVGKPISIAYQTVSGTAVGGEDFVATNGFVIFPPFTTNAQVRIPIIDDSLFEVRPFNVRLPFNDEPEHFFLQLMSATNAALGVVQAQGTIIENDPTPDIVVLVNDPLEGNSGTNLVPVTIHLTGRAARTVDILLHTRRGISFHRERGGNWLFGTALDFDPADEGVNALRIRVCFRCPRRVR